MIHIWMLRPACGPVACPLLVLFARGIPEAALCTRKPKTPNTCLAHGAFPQLNLAGGNAKQMKPNLLPVASVFAELPLVPLVHQRRPMG